MAAFPAGHFRLSVNILGRKTLSAGFECGVDGYIAAGGQPDEAFPLLETRLGDRYRVFARFQVDRRRRVPDKAAADGYVRTLRFRFDHDAHQPYRVRGELPIEDVMGRGVAPAIEFRVPADVRGHFRTLRDLGFLPLHEQKEGRGREK